MIFARPLLASIAVLFSVSALAAKPAKPAKPEAAKAEIELAHQLSSIGEERLRAVVEQFNAGSKVGTVRLTRLAADAKPAALNLVRRYDMDEVLRKPGSYMPLHQMMSRAKEPLNVREVSSDLHAGVVDERGRFVALPVAYSTPVLFYNKNAFRKAGLDPAKAPKTWFEMQGVLDKLQSAGYSCPYTTAWPSWVHIDNVSALSGVPAATDKGQLTFNALPQVKHVAMMATWHKAKYFHTFGRRGEANKKFQEGECAMITTDSWEHTEFADAKGVELGVAPLPHHDDVYGGRQHTLADGASIWVGAGLSAVDYRVAAKFIAFLLAPETQIELVSTYGQLPMTDGARRNVRSKLLRDHQEVLEVAYASLGGKGARPAVRVANIDAARIILDEELEAVWSAQKPAKAALDTAVSRGNAILAAKPNLRKPQPF
jgi:sn-glycerol 3-phosphate transport system substrate-binding protein